MTQNWRWAREARSDIDRAIGRDISFGLDLHHYRDDSTIDDGDPKRQRIRGEEQYDRVRYKADAILNRSYRFDCAPVDEQADPQAAQISKKAIESEIGAPWKRFDAVLEQVVWGGLSARMWAAKLDYVPDLGPDGAIIHSAKDPRMIHWHPDFQDPHHPMCPWLTETVWMPLTDAQARWPKFKDALVADDGSKPVDAAEGENQPLHVTGMPTQLPNKIPHITAVFCYYKNDRSYRSKDSYRDYAPGERYMKCPDCGYQSMTQGELGMPLPEMGGEPCPDCGGPLARQDGEVMTARQRLFANGHRLVVVAPFSPIETPLQDGGWPNERPGYSFRSFQYLLWRSNPHPTDQAGQSEVSLSKSVMCALDAMYRQGYEQIRTSKALTVVPRVGLEDYKREPYLFKDAQGEVAFYTTELPPNAVQRFDPPSMNQSIPGMIQILAGSLKGSQGSSELGMTPQQSRDIPVGTVEALIQTGNVPIDGQVRSLWRELGLYLGCLLDLIRMTYTTQRAVRLWGPDGQAAIKLIGAMDIPDADVIVGPSPNYQQTSMAPGNAMGGPGTGQPVAAPAGAGTNGAIPPNIANRMGGLPMPAVSGVG